LLNHFHLLSWLDQAKLRRILRFLSIILLYITMASAALKNPSILRHPFFTSLMVLQPPQQPATATVIFMHGLGDTANGWMPMLQHELSPSLPHVKFICPTAPQSRVTLNGGMRMTSWHDIVDLNDLDENPPVGLEESVKNVHALIDEEIKAGIPAERIMVAGLVQSKSWCKTITQLLYSSLTLHPFHSSYLSFLRFFARRCHVTALWFLLPAAPRRHHVTQRLFASAQSLREPDCGCHENHSVGCISR
jgi:hypothetical protein